MQEKKTVVPITGRDTASTTRVCWRHGHRNRQEKPWARANLR